MPQHVAFVVNNYPPSVGGTERHVSQLARELVRQGHAATVVTLSDEPGTSVEDGVTVIRVQRHLPIASVISFPAPGETGRIVAQLRNRGITAISTHTRFFPMSAVGISVARRLGVPAVHTEHGSGFVKGVSPLVGLASRAIDVTLGRAVLRRSDAVLAVSGEVAEFVRRLSGVHGDVFYNAIDLADWAVRERSVGPHRFVFLGRLVPGKGWNTLLDATVKLRASVDVQFAVDILGDGPDRETLTARVDELGLADIVAVHGHVGGTTLSALLGAGTLVNPTVLSEGFQTSLLEALAVGSRVITFPVPGVEDLVREAAPIRTVPDPTSDALADAMARDLEDTAPPYAADKLAQWGWPSRARQYVAVLESLSARRA